MGQWPFPLPDKHTWEILLSMRSCPFYHPADWKLSVPGAGENGPWLRVLAVVEDPGSSERERGTS